MHHTVVLHKTGRYRPDIEGLRAVAVAAVVLFHIDNTWLPGGFVGVDIFFVISGYLITANIYYDQQVGNFSLAAFYKRRIRRIMPVLSFVIVATLFAGQFILIPDDYQRLAVTAVAAQLSAANVYFTYFLDTSYFAESANLEPLLHLWSLGVEEQFYLFWPLILTLGLTRLRLQRIAAVISVAIAVSFLLGQILAPTHPMWAYYMLPTRAGQLLAGALTFLAYQCAVERIPSRWWAEAVAVTGMALIVGSLLLLDHEVAFPGLNAAPVTLGAALLVSGGHVLQGSTFVGRVLALPPLIAIGRISYSLYLWHWPVLSFARYLEGDLTLTTKLLALIAMTVLSIFSYFVIEIPFRRDDRRFQTIALRQMLAPSAVIIAVAALVIGTSGYGVYTFHTRYRDAVKALASPKHAPSFPEVCQRSLVVRVDLDEPSCRIGTLKEAKILLWGDSHASHYVGMLSELGNELDFTFRNIAHSSCPPILNQPERFVGPTRTRDCKISGAVVQERLGSFDGIILSGLWQSYLRRDKEFSAELSSTIKDLIKSGKKVLVVGQVPRLRSFDNKCAQKALRFPSIDCRSRSVVERRLIDSINLRVREIAIQSGAAYFDANDHLCVNGLCGGFLNGQPVYFDDGHLSHAGSGVLGRSVRKDPVALAALHRFLETLP